MLVDYLDNRFLRSTLQGLKEHSLRLRWAAEYDNEETQASIVAEATKEHIEITDAFLAGDKDLVFQVVKRHVENSAERLLGANYVNYQK